MINQIYEEIIPEIESKMEDFQLSFENYQDRIRAQIEKLTLEKATSHDIIKMIPSETALRNQSEDTCRKMLEEFQSEIFTRLETWDSRISKIRQDFDINKINKAIAKKANNDEVTKFIEGSNIRMNALDGNF